MYPEPIQMDLFTSASEPALLQPVAGCLNEVRFEDRIHSPTTEPLTGKKLAPGSQELASSLFRKSSELVQKSRCFKPENNSYENLQQHEHPRPDPHQ